MAGGVRIGVAFDSDTLDATPTWTYLTDEPSLVASYQIDRGRQFEFDRTDTGTASISIWDRSGLLDPTLSTAPYYTLLEPLKQIQIELWNPVTSEYSQRYRGWIEDFDFVVDPSQVVTQLTLNCVDLFAILTAIEMQPGQFGDDPPLGAEGQIFFDNAMPGPHDDEGGRIKQVVIENAGVPAAFLVVFSGNVWLQETTYSPGENVLQVVEDCADAEFPTVSNVFCDRFGRLCFHGRLAKFSPATVAATAGSSVWDYREWALGDGAAVIAGGGDTAQIRSLSFNRGLSKVFNSAYCAPNGIREQDIAAQFSTDNTSIGIYGIRSWSAENLLIGHPTTTGNILSTAGASVLTGNSALDETKLYADYIKANYAQPRNRVTELTVKSLDPDDTRAPAVWDFLTHCDISDSVTLTTTNPGGGGFNQEPFYIEGLHESAVPSSEAFAIVTTSIDISAQAYFTPGAWSGD